MGGPAEVPLWIRILLGTVFIIAGVKSGPLVELYVQSRSATRRSMLSHTADRLAGPAPWTALGFVDTVDRAADADDLRTFVLRQIASYRAVGQIGLGMHQAGDRAGECGGDVDHVECVIS